MEQPQKRAVLPAWNAEELEIIEDTKPPEPAQEGFALVRIEATSVQSTDLLQRIGKYPTRYFKDKPPCTLGYDFVGKIVSISEKDAETSGLKLGDRVCDMCISRAHARYIEHPVTALVKVPDGIDPAEATTLVLSWMTAYQMLYRTGTKSIVENGGTIFIAGGAGAVARAAIVLARLKDCTVYVTAREKDHEMLKGLGAIPFDYTSSSWVNDLLAEAGPRGIDAAFDGVGADLFRSTVKVLKSKGHLVVYGVHGQVKQGRAVSGLSMLRLVFNVLPLFIKPGSSFTFFDVSISRHKQSDQFKEDLTELFSLLLAGKIDPRVGHIIDLEDINKYHHMLVQGGVDRKVVCKPT